MQKLLQRFKSASYLDRDFVLILSVAILLRIILLGLRPAHHDEGVNGWFADQINANGFYRYDPHNYHGPLHFYIIFLFQTFLGRSNFILRLPSALVSILSVYWIFLFTPFIGKRAAKIAALGIALSPGLVYFGRFAIHESDLMFFTILILWGIMGLYFEGKTKYLWGLCLGITGTILTKETYIIHLVSFALAWIFLKYLDKFLPSANNIKAKQAWEEKDLYTVLTTCFLLIVFFYSGNLLNPRGLSGIYVTLQIWFETSTVHGAGKGHIKPFLYWIDLFTRYEHIALFGLISSLRYLYPTNIMIRYTAIYGAGVLLAYSIVPYKTPWCFESIMWPFFITFGETIDFLLKTRFNFLTRISCMLLLGLTIFISIRINFFEYCNFKEPYVYVHTSREMEEVLKPLFKLAKEDPSKYSMRGIVLRQDEWPIPWILGNFTNVGYYSYKNIPGSFDADFLIVDKGYASLAEDKLNDQYFRTTFQLRDAQGPSNLYLRYEKFKKFFGDTEPDFIPTEEETLPGQGLIAFFYNNNHWQGSPVLKETVKNIDFYWEGNSPLPPPFSIEFVGEINLHGDTTLSLSTDDGGYLEIDGKRIIDDPGPHGIEAKTALVEGTVGWRKIKIGFYDIGGGAVVKLTKLDPNNKEIYIPSKDFRYNEELLSR